MTSMADLRAMNFAASSRKVVGADWVGGVVQTAPLPVAPTGWLPFELWVALQNKVTDTSAAAEAGWQPVPSRRVLQKRARDIDRRRARVAESVVGDRWLGYGGGGEQHP